MTILISLLFMSTFCQLLVKNFFSKWKSFNVNNEIRYSKGAAKLCAGVCYFQKCN